MKAVVTKGYGGVEVLSLEDIPKPTINENEILVAVKAAAINPLDYKIRSGMFKIVTGKTPPKVLGADFSGVVAEVGTMVRGFEVGDEVFGMSDGMKAKEGSYAEYIKVKEHNLYLKPKRVSFEEAAAIPLVALTAYDALIELANIKKRDTIFINGASGGVGSAAVQIANKKGARVVGTARRDNFAYLKKIGCSNVLDYNKGNIFSLSMKYDIIFDTVGNISFKEAKKHLSKDGVFISANFGLQDMIFSKIYNIFSKKKHKLVMVSPSFSKLREIYKLVEEGCLEIKLFKTFHIENIQSAHRVAQSGGFLGKIALKL